MAKQYYEKLNVSRKWSESIAGIMSLSLADNSLVVYCDCILNEDNDMHLKLSFGVVAAYQSHEEFTHPDMERGNSDAPLKGRGYGYFPVLEVINSQWKASFTDYRLMGRSEGLHHYQILSGSNIVDVLSSDPPELSWVTGDEILNIEAFVDNIS